MRMIISKTEKQKKAKINQLIIGLMLMSLMILSTLGFAFNNNSNSGEENIIYNSIQFVRQGDYWTFSIQGSDFITRLTPKDVENIDFVPSLTLQHYTSHPLYFVGDNGELFNEIAQNLQNRFTSRIGNACISDYECSGDFPIKDCSIDNIIVFKVSNDSIESITKKENCVFIQSSYENQIKYADKFLFSILEI